MTKVGFLEDKRVEVTKGVKVFDKSIAKTDAQDVPLLPPLNSHILNGIVELKIVVARPFPVHFGEVFLRPVLLRLSRPLNDGIIVYRIECRFLHFQPYFRICFGNRLIKHFHALCDFYSFEKNIQKMERMILSIGWDGMDDRKQRQAVKLLGWDRIDELCEMRKEKTPEEKKEERRLPPCEYSPMLHLVRQSVV